MPKDIRRYLRKQWKQLEELRKKFEEATVGLCYISSPETITTFTKNILDPIFSQSEWTPSNDEQLKQKIIGLWDSGYDEARAPMTYVPGQYPNTPEEKCSGMADSEVRSWVRELGNMQVFAQICRFEGFRSKAAQFVVEAGANPLYNLLKKDGEMSSRIKKTEERFDAWRKALKDFRRDLINSPFGIDLSPILFPPEVEGERDDPMAPASPMTPESSLFSAESREDTDCQSSATSVVSASLPDSTLSVPSENGAPGISKKYDSWSGGGCHPSLRPSVSSGLQRPPSLYSSRDAEDLPESWIGFVKCGRETAASSDARVPKDDDYGLSGDEGGECSSNLAGSVL